MTARDARPVRDRPISFSEAMIKALVAGRKTQTRRIIKDVPMFTPEYDRQWYPHVCPPGGAMPNEWSWWEGPSHGPSMYHWVQLPYAKGNLLWVREAWQAWAEFDKVKADDLPLEMRERVNWLADDNAWASRIRPSIHMPRWASRLTLLVTDVRVQRLQDISHDDVLSEGCETYEGRSIAGMVAGWHQPFAQLWESLHGEGAWDANPWVAAISFDVIRANIDALPARAA